MIFAIVVSLLVIQRLIELQIASINERVMKKKGAQEFGKAHYPFIVLIHILFLLSFIIEVTYFNKSISPYWYVLIPILLFAQFIRYWSIFTLGPFWNTKIIVLRNAKVKVKGPYQFIRHPNYVAVVMEIALIPLLFQAIWTAIIFTLLNGVILFIRIREEERALKVETNYSNVFHATSRFFSKKM
ncbi:isoprenylcysteine carboxylmethyltransferase family protein [Bacillus sp. FJAT-47783]|uniref:isoprenylcysteine carboxyl methyltransferase family protein n=1 Tax=Bacillus sp. FJAT-47783 TaxID=2922712 RepID=UPI001FAC67C0|nr:isoprenylcysteine carboxylmethyltransferase family protein [Bacillus sp. FJAT-47783]